VVQVGMAILLVSIPLLMWTIGPELASAAFAIALAGFGGGIGLVISQLSNVVMSPVPESRSSEAGGAQGAAQNLGQSLGTALIGAVLLAGLTTGFQDRVRADASIPPPVQQQLVAGTQSGLDMVSRSQATEIAQQAGLPSAQVDTVVDAYASAQLDALKRALLMASLFVLVGLWCARSLPAEPLPRGSPGTEAGPDGGRRADRDAVAVVPTSSPT
jgi:hypothetical protein